MSRYVDKGNITINKILNDWKRKVIFFFLCIFIFSDYFFFLYLHFWCYSPDCHSFFYPIQDFSFIAPSFIKSSFFLSSCFSYFYLSSFIIVFALFNSFSHWSLQTFLFHSLKIHSVVISVLSSYFPLLILRFPFLIVAISLFFYSILLKHAAILIERDFDKHAWQKEQSEMLILINHPFARPLLHRAIRCTYRP